MILPIECLPYGIMLLDSCGIIQEFNKNIAFMLNLSGLSRNKTYQEVCPAEISGIISQAIIDAREMGASMERRAKINIAGKVDITAAISVCVIQTQSGSIEGFVVICREMTAVQELEKMREFEKLKSDFIAGISHDLKNPLSSILGYVELLMDTVKTKVGKQDFEYLKIIKDETLWLANMINQMLAAARIESGVLKLEYGLVDLNSIIDQAIKLLPLGKVSVQIEFSPQVPLLWLDKEQMIRVFMNLISNAIKYSPDKATVTVKGYIQDQRIKIDIIDQGIGMSQQTLSHLFEKFFRVKSEKTKGIKGTGLGLVVAKGIVEAHGGEITVTSQLAKGSVFSVNLPLVLATNQPIN